jgi:integrase
MARAIPSYRRQRAEPNDRAFVEIRRSRFYLGIYGSEESKAKYARLIAEWKSGSRQAPIERDAITVLELASRFNAHAENYYARPDGKPGEAAKFKPALRSLKGLYGETLAKDFGPRALKAIREKIIEGGACRSTVNETIGRLKRVFKWAVAEELLSPTVFQALEAVPGLRRGRSTAREPEPVRPVPAADVEAIRPHVSRQVWALIQLQMLTGARSGELVILRPCDVDASGAVWLYSPAEHKTAHHGHRRTVYMGPRAQEVLQPFLAGRGPGCFCFSPVEAEAERRTAQHAARKTPLSCGNVPGSNRSRSPKREIRDRYDVGSYAHAIARACKKAKVDHWHPHQLRHAAATFLRKEFGLDAARIILGHRSPSITEVYAELDKAKALEVMGRIG